MKTRASIQLEFRQVTKQAKALSTSAEEMQNINTKLESLMDTLSANWQGESASLYLSKCSTLKERIRQTAADLQKISSVVSQSAQAYRTAELKALEQIQTTNVK